ncbi:hypothetical protein [Rhodovulum visakhapatnamense]|uniref:Uncharacterized protein n=1 Tax=Rhodovulum visakhapatnamense TaxID=364297 RepID=A0ABS1RLT3_9RHOB|nr:hypothetical protein [Rhodovulum visakhapatnamense]MBL3571990.1 hypothetical protein [Rhodovulum visakhapatnamense]MBL3580646.1 hypothetical protein [Rhodovulum visakhapatnamense]
MRGAARAATREAGQQRWLVWHLAALMRAGKLPSFEKFVGRPTVRRRQSPQEMLTMARIWHATLQGIARDD